MTKSKVKGQRSRLRQDYGGQAKVGEVGTAVMIVMLVLASIIGLGSSTFLSKKQTTSTKAAQTTCRIGYKNCGSGNAYPCTSSNGCNPSVCTTKDLEFNCCVEDYNACLNKSKYRWFGCLGQPCNNTIISQRNGPGYLVPCPINIGRENPDSCSDVTATPVPTATSAPSGGTKPWDGCLNYLNYNECRAACTNEHPGYSCQSSPGTTDKKWCCPPETGGEITKQEYKCRSGSTASYWYGSDKKFYSSQDDPVGESTADNICFSNCTGPINCCVAVNRFLNKIRDKYCYFKYENNKFLYFDSSNTKCSGAGIDLKTYCTTGQITDSDGTPVAGQPEATVSPTPFCQNISVPEIYTGITVGLANDKGEGRTLSIDDIINSLIKLGIKDHLANLSTIEEVRVRLAGFIGKTILQGIGQALTELADKVALTPLMYFKINNILIPTPLVGYQDLIKIVGVVLKNNGAVYTQISETTGNFVNSVINNICQ